MLLFLLLLRLLLLHLLLLLLPLSLLRPLRSPLLPLPSSSSQCPMSAGIVGPYLAFFAAAGRPAFPPLQKNVVGVAKGRLELLHRNTPIDDQKRQPVVLWGHLLAAGWGETL